MSEMTFTITSQREADDPDESSRCFYFVTNVDDSAPRAGHITLHTAQTVANEVAQNTGLAAMLRAIVAAMPSEYESLVELQFGDK